VVPARRKGAINEYVVIAIAFREAGRDCSESAEGMSLKAWVTEQQNKKRIQVLKDVSFRKLVGHVFSNIDLSKGIRISTSSIISRLLSRRSSTLSLEGSMGKIIFGSWATRWKLNASGYSRLVSPPNSREKKKIFGWDRCDPPLPRAFGRDVENGKPARLGA
jgi:hypothetical protein